MRPERRPFALALVCALVVSAPLWAQPADDTTAVDAFRCWRRLSQHAVRVGERFTMTVTCSTVETDQARAVPDPVALEPASIDVAPFEVLDGERFEDAQTGPYRFFQYRYTLRLITETSFGEDVELPALQLIYRVERRIGSDPALAGREFTYVLPPEPIRVVSLVPGAVVDIRDLPPATLGDSQDRVFRANALTLGAALLGVMAVGVLLLGVTRAARMRRGDAPRVDRPISPSLVVSRAHRELTAVQRASEAEGWTDDGRARALAALRVAGAVARTGAVPHTVVGADTPARDGQLRIRRGLLRRQTVVVSSGVTAPSLVERVGESGSRAVGDGQLMADLAEAISAFTRARYGRSDDVAPNAHRHDDADLTSALNTGLSAVKRLRWLSTSPVRAITQLRALLAEWVTWKR
jgi:hypothetical protein